jgi:hypothetical protein
LICKLLVMCSPRSSIVTACCNREEGRRLRLKVSISSVDESSQMKRIMGYTYCETIEVESANKPCRLIHLKAKEEALRRVE